MLTALWPASPYLLLADALAGIRAMLPPGMVCSDRMPSGSGPVANDGIVDSLVGKLLGDLVQFLYRNPHSFVHVEVKNPKTNETVRWAVEWGAGGQLGHEARGQQKLHPEGERLGRRDVGLAGGSLV